MRLRESIPTDPLYVQTHQKRYEIAVWSETALVFNEQYHRLDEAMVALGFAAQHGDSGYLCDLWAADQVEAPSATVFTLAA